MAFEKFKARRAARRAARTSTTSTSTSTSSDTGMSSATFGIAPPPQLSNKNKLLLLL